MEHFKPNFINLVPGVFEIRNTHLCNKTTHFMAEIPFLLHKLGIPYLKYPWNQIHEIRLEMLHFAFWKGQNNKIRTYIFFYLSLFLNPYREFMLKNLPIMSSRRSYWRIWSLSISITHSSRIRWIKRIPSIAILT